MVSGSRYCDAGGLDVGDGRLTAAGAGVAAFGSEPSRLTVGGAGRRGTSGSPPTLGVIGFGAVGIGGSGRA